MFLVDGVLPRGFLKERGNPSVCPASHSSNPRAVPDLHISGPMRALRLNRTALAI